MKTAYPAIIHYEDDGYWVEFPDLEGCFSDGETLADAASNASEALGMYICSLMERNLEVPRPSDARSVVADDGIVTVVATEPLAYRKSTKSVKKTLTIPDSVASIGADALPRKAETLNVGCASYARAWAIEQNYVRDTDASASALKYHVNHTGYIYPNAHVSPTETTPGQTGGTHCSACGEVFIPSRVIPALKDMNTLRLPAGLLSVEDEAFTGLACQAAIIPDGCQEIGAGAFADCANLIYVRIPLSVTYIAPDAFDGCAEGLIQDFTLD